MDELPSKGTTATTPINTLLLACELFGIKALLDIGTLQQGRNKPTGKVGEMFHGHFSNLTQADDKNICKFS